MAKLGWESKSEYRMVCPACHRKTFSYNIEKEVGHCWVCNHVTKSIPTVMGKLKGGNCVKFKEGRTKPELSPMLYPKQRTYLYARNLNDSQINQLAIDLVLKTDDKQELYFLLSPVVEPESNKPRYIKKCMYQPGYFIEEGVSKIKYGYNFGWELLRKDLNKIVLVEGVFDLLSNQLEGFGIAILGLKVSDTLAIAISKRFKEVYLWLDYGKHELKQMEKIKEKFENTFNTPCRVLTEDIYDTFKYCGDPGDFPKLGVKNYIPDLKRSLL